MNTPPCIVNLIDRDNLECDTVDILYYLTKEGFVRYLDNIKGVFSMFDIKNEYDKNQMYFIAQDDFEAIKIGVTKKPKERLVSLQTGNPRKLSMLYYYDPVQYNLDLDWKSDGDDVKTATEHEKSSLRWYTGAEENILMGEWFKPDDRSFRMLIRHGLDVLGWYKEKMNA